jgi:hypothetical protein
MTFEEADRQYQQLLSQWQAGQINRQGFMQALDKLQIQTADGGWWRLRPADGAWLRWDGASWIATTPPHKLAPPAAPPSTALPAVSASPVVAADPPRKRGRRRWLTCLVIVLLMVCCLGLVAGGGYLAVQAGSVSALQLSSQLSGAADVSLVNLDDHLLTVSLERLDVAEEDSWFDSQRLEPFDIGGFSSLQPGRYQLDFESDGNPILALSCTIAAENGDVYRFVAVPEGLAIAREGEDARSAAELDASTSSLCRR